jgi:hypothetical protein
MPPPELPYYPAYPETERPRLEASYRAELDRWHRETALTMKLNLAMATLGPLAMLAAVVGLIWLGPDMILIAAGVAK